MTIRIILVLLIIHIKTVTPDLAQLVFLKDRLK